MHLLKRLTADVSWNKAETDLQDGHQVDGKLCSAGCHLCYGVQSDLILSRVSHRHASASKSND
ncbi:hypothetical protein BDR05DRAFT_967705 [Suillus weaverae]|nr:hypothetical protein BDR05DRAFT_967705 [Suillus weaverae]